MGKTFEEWYFENEDYLERLAECRYVPFTDGKGNYIKSKSLMNIAKEAWEASRQHMTKGDI